MENREDSKSATPSWWQTVPGILTAIAALITAAGGFLIVLNQIGCFDTSVHKDSDVIQTPSGNKETGQSITKSKSSEKQDSKDNPANTENTVSGNLVLPDDMNFGSVRIKFLELTTDKYSEGNSSLKIKFRLFNDGTGYATFDYYLFRLLFDGQVLSPEKSAQGYIDPKSSKDSEVLFVFPDSIKSAELELSYVYDEKQTSKISINLK